MTEVGRCDGFGFLEPRTIEGAALGVGNTLGVDVINPTCPYHAETPCGSAEEVGTVSDFVGAHLAVLHFTAPRRCGSTEEDGALSDGAAEVGLELYLLDGAIPVLQPFATIDHVRLAVGVHPEGAVEGGLICRQVGGVSHRAIRTRGLVADKDVGSTSGNDIATHGVYLHGIVGESGKIVVLAFVVVKFCRPYLRSETHP